MSAAILPMPVREPAPVKKDCRRQIDGLRKRCMCKQPTKCRHPWHFSFFRKTCSCVGLGDVCEHRKQNRIRVSLHKFANKLPSYEMSKTEAEGWADKIRSQVREGTFGQPAAQQQPAPEADSRMTFGDVADRYLKSPEVLKPGRREAPIKALTNYIRIVRAAEIPGPNGSTVRFEQKPIAQVTKPDIEAVREARRARLRANAAKHAKAATDESTGKKKGTGRIVLPGEKAGEVGIEHMMAELRHLLDWAVGEGYIESSPFKRNGRVVIKVKAIKKVHRTRRLDMDTKEEERLLKAAKPVGRREAEATHLHDLIVAALETGCRRGELLTLQWKQIIMKGGQMAYVDLPADKTKTNDPRTIPITAPLRAILEYRRIGPDGKKLGPEAYVFGNACGEPVGRIYTAWQATCRRAGIKNLHFHDLRHEFISRMLEAGVPIHKVRDWAGHRNIATTGIYANTTLAHLDEARKRFEAATIMRIAGPYNLKVAEEKRWR
jgi:integrase